ncbi:MAG: aminotransferase class [candidate division NC10 bacterium]|nr:aminotransferase class [candidate division NC10 bacterium]
MLDFTSALYLAMDHGSRSLRPWQALTTGRPAALESPPGAVAVAADLARLIGCDQATLGTSTLHIFFDLFEMLGAEDIALFVDAGIYPIARWGVERAASKGVPVTMFPAHDPIALEHALARKWRSGGRSVIVTDGLSTATGRPAPLDRYLPLVRARRGYLVVDDTQALGVLGERPSRAEPYGRGGGGTCAWYGLRAPELIVVSSLSKGFGVPLAVLAGSSGLIQKFEASGSCRVHCSAPSAAHISAAEHALALNHSHGASLRRRLALGVQRFRQHLLNAGLPVSGGFFPVQTPSLGGSAEAIHAELLANGIRSVLHQRKSGSPALLSFLISAEHQPWEIDGAAEILCQAASQRKNRMGFTHHEQFADLYP